MKNISLIFTLCVFSVGCLNVSFAEDNSTAQSGTQDSENSAHWRDFVFPKVIEGGVEKAKDEICSFTEGAATNINGCRPTSEQTMNLLTAAVYIGDCANTIKGGGKGSGAKTGALSCILGAKMIDDALGLGVFSATGLDSLFGDSETDHLEELMERVQKIEETLTEHDDRITAIEQIYTHDKKITLIKSLHDTNIKITSAYEALDRELQVNFSLFKMLHRKSACSFKQSANSGSNLI